VRGEGETWRREKRGRYREREESEMRKTGVRGERQSERKEKGVRGEKRGRVRG
jgi:hypothetical protein